MTKTIAAKGEWRFPVEKSFVTDASLSVEARLLFIILRSYVGPDKPLPFPSLNTLAIQMDRHRKSVQRHLAELESAGWLERTHAQINGRFASTRYVLFDRRHNLSLRQLPTTVKVPTKSTQSKEVPESEEDQSKEAKETPPVGGAVGFKEGGRGKDTEARWKPSRFSKEQQLRRLKVPTDYPSQDDFDTFLDSENLDAVAGYRSDLYGQLCDRKWHEWKQSDNRWVPIRNWKRYTTALNDRIEITA